jgi:hypothetical protein
MSPPAPDPGRSPASALRLIALAMAAALAVLVVLAVVLQPAGRYPLPATAVWILGALGAGNLVVGTLLGATADPAAAGYPARILISLALREAAGLLGAVTTLLGADVGWAIGLGGAAVVALVALLPRPVTV